MTKPQLVLFDIGSTLWSSPAEHPDALSHCYGRGRQILIDAMGEAPPMEALIKAVEGYLAEWEDIWRTKPDIVEQPPTYEYVATALQRIDLAPPIDALKAFTDAVMETSVYTAKYEAPEPGMAESMAALKALGLGVGCVSNAFMSAETLHAIMSERNLGQYIDFTISSCDLGWRKPHARIYQAALDKGGVTGAAAVFVGDRLDADIEGPAALGMGTVLSHQYRQEDPAKASAKPDEVIAHLRDLPPYLSRLLGP